MTTSGPNLRAQIARALNTEERRHAVDLRPLFEEFKDDLNETYEYLDDFEAALDNWETADDRAEREDAKESTLDLLNNLDDVLKRIRNTLTAP